MGIFNRSKTPPPAASEASHTGAPIANTTQQPQPVVNNQTGTTYTPTSEMPAPQYTQHAGQQPIHIQDGINTAPPPPGANEPHYPNEKTAGYTSDPNLLHSQQQQQVYPDATAQQQQFSQSQIHVQQPPTNHQQPQYSNADFHAHDKATQAQQAQQQHNGQQQQQGQQRPGNVYNVARPLHSLQGRSEVVDCPNCGVRELTRTEFASGGTTHAAAALCCFCFCLGCIPYIGHWIKNCEHYCGNCNQLLAIWHRSGDTEVIQRRQGQQPNGQQQPQSQQQSQQQKPGGPGATTNGAPVYK